MKRIDKSDVPPKSFEKWVKTNPQSWNDIHKTPESQAVYDELAESLRKEQGNLCCYCELPLLDGKLHVEHFQEQSRHPDKRYDYDNLLASCGGNKQNHKNYKHCGHKRQSVPYQNILSPLLENIEQMFSYDLQCKMEATNPNDQQIVDSTIKTLGLNCEKLVRLRKAVFDVLSNRQEHETEDDFKTWISKLLEKNSEGHYEKFWTVVDYFFGSRAGESLLRKDS